MPMSRKDQARQAADILEEARAAEAMLAPSSGLINPALALAPLEIAGAATVGWLECWRLGLAASRVRQDDLWHAWRAQNDAVLKAIEGLAVMRLQAQATQLSPTQERQAANDTAASAVANRALAPSAFWLEGAQALTPFATRLGGPWWSALLDHDRRPQA
jgi:hypothetical protein